MFSLQRDAEFEYHIYYKFGLSSNSQSLNVLRRKVGVSWDAAQMTRLYENFARWWVWIFFIIGRLGDEDFFLRKSPPFSPYPKQQVPQIVFTHEVFILSTYWAPLLPLAFLARATKRMQSDRYCKRSPPQGRYWCNTTQAPTRRS